MPRNWKMWDDLRRETSYRQASLKASQKVYFIRAANNRVKIGLSSDPIARLNQVKPTCPVDVELWGVLERGESLEFELHQRFAPWLYRNEWFDLSPEVKDTIELLLFQPQQLTLDF